MEMSGQPSDRESCFRRLVAWTYLYHSLRISLRLCSISASKISSVPFGFPWIKRLPMAKSIFSSIVHSPVVGREYLLLHQKRGKRPLHRPVVRSLRENRIVADPGPMAMLCSSYSPRGQVVAEEGVNLFSVRTSIC